jgi:hypothetical protein
VYYYIVATLPFLSFSGTTETGVERFLEFTRSMLPEKDYLVLQSVYENAESAHPFVARAAAFRAEFAAELARYRAQALGKDPNQYAKGSDPRVGEKARQCVAMENPLEAEMAVMRFSWDFLDGLESGHFFDLERLVVHLLKLMLLERKNKLTEERGTARYTETYQNITKPLEDAEIGV